MTNKPLTLVEMMCHQGNVYIEFRIFPKANSHMGIYDAMLWADRVFKHYGIKTPRYDKDWRMWKEKPTDEERTVAPWEM